MDSAAAADDDADADDDDDDDEPFLLVIFSFVSLAVAVSKGSGISGFWHPINRLGGVDPGGIQNHRGLHAKQYQVKMIARYGKYPPVN